MQSESKAPLPDSGYDPAVYSPPQELLADIRDIENGNAEKLNACAKALGAQLTKKLEVRGKGPSPKDEKPLSTAQVRAVLDAIQHIPTDKVNVMLRGLQLVRPRLAYAAGRHQGRVRQFQGVVDAAIECLQEQVNAAEDARKPLSRDEVVALFENLKAFVEAIVAYHRLAGGKE